MPHYAALPRAIVLALPMVLGTWSVQAADIVRTAERDGRFNGFLALLEAAGMAETLKGEGPFTVFAPIDEAFDQLPPGTLARLLAEEDRKPSEAVVQSHIVRDAALMTGDLLGQAVEVATLGGGTLAIDGTTGIIVLAPIGASVTEMAIPISAVVVQALQDSGADADRPATLGRHELASAAAVVEPDIEADNGVIHGIDLVLLPPEVWWSF